MNNLQDLKKRIDKRKLILGKIMIGESVIFEIKNNFFLGGIFQEAISKINTKKLSKMSATKQKEELQNNIDIQALYKAIENAIKGAYTFEEYEYKVNELKRSNDALNEFLDSVLEDITLAELYDIQLGLNNDNFQMYNDVLKAMTDGVDTKKQAKKIDIDDLIDWKEDLPNIEASYKSKYNSDFSNDCNELTYSEIMSRIMNIDDDNFGEVLRLRSLELNNFSQLQNADSKTKSDYKKRARKVLTENRKAKKKNEAPKIAVLQNRAKNTMNKYLE